MYKGYGMPAAILSCVLGLQPRGTGADLAPSPSVQEQVRVISGLDLEMQWIPAGTFMMGSTASERAWAAGPEGQGLDRWYADEREAFEVHVDYGFWMGRTAVTRAMFEQFADAEGYRTDAEQRGKAYVHDLEEGRWSLRPHRDWRNPGFPQEETHPAVCISWNDAVAFCDWLTRTEREAGRLPECYVYRLPGEAEWEYAARGGNQGAMFWWGDELAAGEGRLNGAGADPLPDGSTWGHGYGWEDGHSYTSPVDYYGPRGRNGFGLADMLGNVWEWCADGYDEKGPHAVIKEGDGFRRVLRGGSFFGRPGNLRCANRLWRHRATPVAVFGFRIVLAPAIDGF